MDNQTSLWSNAPSLDNHSDFSLVTACSSICIGACTWSRNLLWLNRLLWLLLVLRSLVMMMMVMLFAFLAFSFGNSFAYLLDGMFSNFWSNFFRNDRHCFLNDQGSSRFCNGSYSWNSRKNLSLCELDLITIHIASSFHLNSIGHAQAQ